MRQHSPPHRLHGLTRGLGVGLLVFGAAASLSAQQFTRSTAAVVAWNFAGFTAIPAPRQVQIARALMDLDAELVAAVEVNPDHAIHDVAAALTELGTCYDARILDQTANQNIGVLFKCEVQVTNPRLVPGSDDGQSSLRKAFAVDVRVGEFDFLVVVLHLKAGRSAQDRATRTRQVGQIATFLAGALGGAERDVLVVGDYNMIPGEDAANFDGLNPGNMLRFISTEDLVGQPSHLPGSGSCEGGNLLDGFAVSRDHTGEYIEASLRIYPMHRALGMTLCGFRSEVSDHLPLIARFRILADDDGVGPGGGGGAGTGIRIVALLPNPAGSDHNAEQVTLRNLGGGDVSLVGWRIADLGGNEFPLSGTIAAGATHVITLQRSAMLNNDGDEVRLLSPSGVEHTVRYDGPVASGEVVMPPE